MDSKRIDDLVNRHSGQITKMIQDLVDIPTENNPPCGFEAKGQEYVAAVFKKMALDIDKRHNCVVCRSLVMASREGPG